MPHHIGNGAAPPGLAAPNAAKPGPDSTKPTIAGSALLEGQEARENRVDCAGRATEPQLAVAHTKVLQGLRARLALAGGYVLHELADGGFIVSRWGRTAHLIDLDGVATFLRRVAPRRPSEAKQ